MTEKEALTIFRTIQKCRHQALHTNDCGNCERCQYRLEQEQIDGAVALAISALEKQEKDRWHPVAKEGNPQKSGLYIVVDNSKLEGDKPHTRYFNAYGDRAFWSGWRADKVVAWKEITSEPYTEDEDEEQKSSN